MKYDFSGYATKNDLVCSDGRIIRKDAFKDNDGRTVPLVWNHMHNGPENILGHALLQNKEDGVYAYCKFNDTEQGRTAKLLVQHGDINALSIYANQLKQDGPNVKHGNIREVSLVLAGANMGAFIDSVSMTHGMHGGSDDEGIIYTDETISLTHADDSEDTETEKKKMANENTEETKSIKSSGKEKTVADVFNTLTEEQKTVVYALIGQALEENSGSKKNSDEEEEEDKEMKHNVFEDGENVNNSRTLSHSDIQAIFADAKRTGSLADAVAAHNAETFLQHDTTDSSGNTVTYGIADVDYLFPDARNYTNQPIFIQRKMEWVGKVMSAVHNSPFSRVKSIFADITEDDARALGYIKGNAKKNEVFTLLKRTTTPITIYKKQKMDRDDVVDITDFDVVSWIKAEMRTMLDEEIARAILIGDGRLSSSDDKISESNIRPIATDDDLFTIKSEVSADSTDDDAIATAFIKAAIKARKDYRGSGQPTLYTTEDILTNCLLLTDSIGRDLYTDEAQLAKKLRVKEIVTVPVMESATGSSGGTLLGIIVNLADYNVGADKGGAINLFDDFDINYNQQLYLIETRCSGALTKPYSAIALELASTSSTESTDEG